MEGITMEMAVIVEIITHRLLPLHLLQQLHHHRQLIIAQPLILSSRNNVEDVLLRNLKLPLVDADYLI